jgi:serine/threonine protein kinase
MTDPLQDRAAAALGDQYRIEREIGRGGMSVVYRARDLRLNRAVAVKVLPPELAYDPAVASRFTREAQMSAQLSHPHIVPIYDVGERDGLAYFVMALVSGGNLAGVLEQHPLRSVDEVRRLLAEVADALGYAHLRGVVHRDVKADNILLDGDSGRAMVTDFGIARAVEGATRLTLTGIAVGTPTYMSPEQALGERDVDGRSDIYSLGVLGYQMLTGRVPFTAGNQMALLLKHVSEAPRPIAEFRPEAPRALCEIIERAMMKAPADRWPTASAMRDALRDSTNVSAAPVWRAESREPVRYTSPLPRGRRTQSPRRGSTAVAPASAVAPVIGSNGVILEPAHLAALTPEQRSDLRLWGGRVALIDRVILIRRYTWLSLATSIGAMVCLTGVSDIPPLMLAPLVPLYLWFQVWRRGISLHASGLRIRRVLSRPTARWVLRAYTPQASDKQLAKLAPRAVLDGPRGSAIRRAVEDRAAIMDLLNTLSRPDRALLPEIEPTVDALVARVAHLVQVLHRLDGDIDPSLVPELESRIAEARIDQSPDGQRRLALLQRQRDTADELTRRHAALMRQIESARLALGNLRLDLIKLRSSGLEAAPGVSSAGVTQEARALSRQIALALEAAAEVGEI